MNTQLTKKIAGVAVGRTAVAGAEAAVVKTAAGRAKLGSTSVAEAARGGMGGGGKES